MMEKKFYVYILASKRNGTLYLGVTSDIVKRVWQHKNGLTEGFTKKYGIKRLVYYEIQKTPNGVTCMQIYVNKLDSRVRGNDVLLLRGRFGMVSTLTNW